MLNNKKLKKERKKRKKKPKERAFVFNIIKILNKYKIFQDHLIRKFSNTIDWRKLDFLSAEK